jgi:myosin heavy subunit
MSRLKVFIPDETNVWLLAEKIGDPSNDQKIVEVQITDPLVTGDEPDNKSILKTINLSTLPNGLTNLPLQVFGDHVVYLLEDDNFSKQNDDICDTGVDDMCCLSHLHEASILDNLRRYSHYPNFQACNLS